MEERKPMPNSDTSLSVISPPDTLPVRSKPNIIVGGQKYSFVNQVTRTVLSQKGGEPIFVEFESPMRKSTVIDPSKTEAPMIADVVNLTTGELQVLVCNTVMVSELNRFYPDEGYVGKSFAMSREKAAADKRHYIYKIVEIKPEPSSPGGAVALNVINRGDEAVDDLKKNRVNKKSD